MPHALLLSPDDQAVSAITAVLEEMSVTCERPLDGPSAAKKLSAQSFDLVLVDCENLPAAKLIFDVCRRSQTGTNPVPIAIVDGRAGLPTAFRLGAELILTKPVAKDQARTTIRTAVSRVRKDEPAVTIRTLETPHAETAHSPAETLSHAAAAGAASSPVSSENAPANARMSSATEEIPAAPLASKPAAPALSAASPAANISLTDMFMPAAKTAPVKPSDDPILADLESDLPTPAFSGYAAPKKKASGSLVALFVLVLLGGGLYAAWMYVPEFREFAQPQVDRLMGMIGKPGTAPAASASRPVPASAGATAPAAQAVPVKSAPVSGAAAEDSASVATAPNPASTETTAPTQSVVASTPPPASASATPASEPAKPAVSAESKKTAAEPSAEAALPGEQSAVILSSQGAEKRLLRHVQPAYPAEARKSGIEGTVVLKTVVSETGVVDGVRLVEGNPALAAAAIGSVKQWRYRPYIRDGKARPFQTIVLVEFQRP